MGAVRTRAHKAPGFRAPGSSPTGASRWSEVPALSVAVMCGVLAECGIDSAPPLRAARIPHDVLRAPDRAIGWPQELAFQREFARLTSDRPDIWVHTGRKFVYPMFDALGMAMFAAPTLRHFFDLVTSLDTYYSVGTYRVLDAGPTRTGLELSMPADIDPHTDFYRFTVCRDAAALALALDDLWQAPFPLDRIEIQWDPVPAALQDLQPAPVVTAPADDAAGTWIFSAELLDLPLPRSSSVLYAFHASRAQHSPSWLRPTAQLDEQVAAILGQPGNAGLSLVRLAAELAMSPRTLQRRLDEANVSFRELRDAARRTEACRLLRDDDLRISEIAERLAYFEVASFSNAFRRWTGESPSQYRQRHQQKQTGELLASGSGS